ncbi:MAG: response regulator [bacterium]|nr:response regulator [bacterium]
MGIVWTERGKCKRCYVCVRNCPAKAIMVKEGQAQVISTRCISCGVCVRLCKQGAKRVRDDVRHVLKLLMKKGKKAVILSPSFVATFRNVGSFVTSLRLLGFDYVEEGGYGANLVIDEYKRLIEERKEGIMIASNCSAVVGLIERYYPGLIKYLLKVVPHMIASTLSIKKRVGEGTHIVYIGPCVAKKEEIREKGIKTHPDVVLTFQELKELFRKKEIDFDSQDEGSFDTPPFDPTSSLISLEGGLSRLVVANNKWIKEEECVVINGREECIEVLNDLVNKKVSPRFLEISFCKGCIDGPGVDSDLSLFARRERVLSYVRSCDKKVIEPVKIDLSTDFSDRFIPLRTPTEEEIRDILKKTNKLRPEDELDCGACGYNTCREKAISVYQGLAEIEMCLPYLINHITQEKNSVIDTIVRSMNDAVFTVDRDLKITLFNDAAEELTGFSRSEVLGKPHSEVFRGTEGCPLEIVMRTDKPISNYEMRIFRKDGKGIPISVSANILKNEEGKVIGGVAIFRDISRIKEIEQMKSDFVSNVSHELRTPLTSIKGSVDLLLAGVEGELTQSQKRFLEIVKSNTERLIRLISDLLDLSRIEAGRVEMRKVKVDLIPFIKETITEMKRLAEDKGIKIHLSLPHELPKISVDIDRIRQVIANLLSNAIKYTKEKGEIFIEALALEKDIKVSVKDTGIGISPENFERIFEKFQPVDKELASVGKSIGLGLSISRSIVEAHKGKLWVEESQIGKGSRFSFILPKETKEEEIVQKRITEIEPVEAEGRVLHKIRKVLVVDNDQDVVQVIETYLKKEGYEVFTAYSGKEAIEKAIKFLPDIITLDLLMPEVDGFQVIETLKGYPETHDIPIIIISIVEDVDHEKVLRLGIADYLVKPITSDALYSSIRNIEAWLDQAKTKKRILIVDDEPSVVEVIKDALTKKGYMVVSAYDGEEAVILAKRNRPALILLDLIMPKMSGFKVIRELKRDKETNAIPIIALTARDLEEDKALALKLGASEYLTKPFSQDVLVEKIMEQISRA